MTARLIALTAAVKLATAGGAALASSATLGGGVPANAVAVRGPIGSDQNLRRIRHRLEGVIDALQQDQHDYAGHRVTAINDLRQARTEIDAALAADAGH